MFIKVKYYGASEFETNRFDTAIKDYQVRHGIFANITSHKYVYMHVHTCIHFSRITVVSCYVKKGNVMISTLCLRIGH